MPCTLAIRKSNGPRNGYRCQQISLYCLLHYWRELRDCLLFHYLSFCYLFFLLINSLFIVSFLDACILIFYISSYYFLCLFLFIFSSFFYVFSSVFLFPFYFILYFYLLSITFIYILPFFMVSHFLLFSASLYFPYSFIFLPIVDTYTYTMMSVISYIKLNMTNFCDEYFLNFLSHKIVAANKQGIHSYSLSACYISKTALFSRNRYVGFIVRCFGQFSSYWFGVFFLCRKMK
jgi:hypothetical protein